MKTDYITVTAAVETYLAARPNAAPRSAYTMLCSKRNRERDGIKAKYAERNLLIDRITLDAFLSRPPRRAGRPAAKAAKEQTK